MSVLALGAISSSFHAECSSSSCRNVTIDKIFISRSGIINIKTSGNERNLISCRAINGNELRLDFNITAKNELYDILVTAKADRSRINVNVVPNSFEACTISGLDVGIPSRT